ncbi:zinc transporter [Coxiella burnetii]|uniref:ZIP family metal transporter n=1 Tax=Coxiella burnetii TaxID=777 RepID=UPI00037B1295|nr:zinc transporter [Coxiella burnetii]AML48077.1 zinc transporter [Coxiella burnetii]AML54100.1 zinc transporter [Coxiella burnetii]ATN68062.1 zinc transporter [Coxiella burnetii]ATN69990.1 zinc transporter [Coxiella burnetii]ATN71945.1 zinc transporter [Coxiella burnetii]
MISCSAVLRYTSIPVLLMIVGGILSFLKKPSPSLTSAVQHFAAGVVFAAVAAELIPVLLHHHIRWIIVIGFAAGVFVMLLTEWFADKLSTSTRHFKRLPLSLIVVVAIDVFIDGILVGVSFLANSRSGIIIALALALETLFLGMATTLKMADNKVHRALGIFVIFLIGLFILIGASLGFGIVSGLSLNFRIAIIAFGVAALLYLVAEELLTEAHEVPETRLATVAFFVGFLIVLFVH